MLNKSTLKTIQEKFGFETMIRVSRMEGILHTAKRKDSDFLGLTSFGARVEKKFSKLLGEDSTTAIQTMDLLNAAHFMEQCIEMDGVAGCVVKDLDIYIKQTQDNRIQHEELMKQRQDAHKAALENQTCAACGK